MDHPFTALKHINKLSELESYKDLKPLSKAQFPGTHCPLFGVAMTAAMIEDLAVVIVGTEECTYYTKNFSAGRKIRAQSDIDQVKSFIMNRDDVVFGIAEPLAEAIRTIDREESPAAIMLVTTCVPELIGEDLSGVIYSLKHEIRAKLTLVKTEHFKCNSHIPGIERTLTGLVEFMEEQPVNPQLINILGPRSAGIQKSEIIGLLKTHGYEIHQILPSKSSMAELTKAPAVRLNIVTDFTALPMAEAMKKRFGTDFVYMDKYLKPDRIAEVYRNLGLKLNIDLEGFIHEKMGQLKGMMHGMRQFTQGKSFIYGNTPMLAFEISGFFCSLGMSPILIQARDLYSEDPIFINEILDMGYNPYVTQIANIAPLQNLYGILKPSVYIGHENPGNLARHGISQLVLDAAATKLGFEVPMTVLRILGGVLQKEEMKHEAV